MPNELDEDEMVVDERIIAGHLVAGYVWVFTPTWSAILELLPVELREDVEATALEDGPCAVIPRIIWLLVLAVTDVRSMRN